MQLPLPLLSIYEALVADSPLVRIWFRSGRYWNWVWFPSLDWQTRFPFPHAQRKAPF